MKGRKWLFSLRTRLTLCMSIVVFATVLVLGLQFYSISRDVLSDITAKNVLHTMINTIEMADQRYEMIKTATLELLGNQQLYDMLKDIDAQGISAYLRHAADLRKLLQNTLSEYGNVWAAEILFGHYRVSYSKTHSLRYGSLEETDVWRHIQAKCGEAVWLARGDMPDAIIADESVAVLWHARALNVIDKTTFRTLFSPKDEKPVLLVCIRDEYPRDALRKSIAQEHAAYALLDKHGAFLDGSPSIGHALADSDMLLTQPNAGIAHMSVLESNALVLYARSQVTGWLHVVSLDPDALAARVLSGMTRSISMAASIMLLAMLGMTSVLSHSIARAAGALIRAMREMESGKFGMPIRYRAYDDFSYLIERFNEMNDRIRRLIDENYHVQIREKDAEIAMLNVQFNPHYLYNTLNAIHWVITLGEANRADRMILALSSMLRYTSDNKCELTPLRNDVEWLKKYLTLMNLRYENGFDSVWEIPEALMDLPIPKLFLQPFIENSIVHGFPDREKGGKIVICAREETDKWTFMVSDNGVGIPPERICGLLSEDGRASGMQNVRRRIQLMYGEKEGVTIQACPGGGTRVIIQIPKGSLMI